MPSQDGRRRSMGGPGLTPASRAARRIHLLTYGSVLPAALMSAFNPEFPGTQSAIKVFLLQEFEIVFNNQF